MQLVTIMSIAVMYKMSFIIILIVVFVDENTGTQF